MGEKQTVLALGFFDGVHIGHAALIERAKAVAAEKDAVPAVMTFDDHPDRFVKKTPVELISSAHDRRYILHRFFAIEDVYFLHFNELVMRMPWQEFLARVTEAYHPVHFVVGHDFCFGYKGEGTAEKLRDYCAAHALGCDVIPAVYHKGVLVSSTHLRSLLKAGEVETANEFLGHPYLLTDTVHTGFRLGRTMEHPTVNMRFSEGVLIPKQGAYISRVVLPDGAHTAITNIGTRPTFGGEGVTVESHILGCDRELYGVELCVEFYRYLRTEQKFETPEALSAQLRQDARQAMEFFGN